MVETWKKQEPIEPANLLEYRSIKKKHKKEDKTMEKAMGKTVAKAAMGKGKAAKGKGGKQKSIYEEGNTASCH